MLRELLSERVHGSIDIGTRNIRGLTLNGGRVDRIVKRGIVGSESREERITEGLEAALGEVIDELNLKNKRVKVSISGQRFYSKSIVIARDEDEDKRLELIQEELESIIPNYDPLDFLTEEIPIRKDEDEEEVLTISIERERVDALLDILTKLKVTVVRLVPDYVACYHLMEKIIEIDEEDEYRGVTGVIDVGFEGTKVYFVDKNGIKMFINTLIGGGEFTEIIREHKNTTYIEAENVKKKMELGEKLEDDSGEVAMFTDLTNAFKELEGNISLSLDYFSKKNISSNIRRLVLVGEGSLLKGFKDYLHENVRIETDYISYEGLDIGEELEAKFEDYHSVELANLLGNVAGEVS